MIGFSAVHLYSLYDRLVNLRPAALANGGAATLNSWDALEWRTQAELAHLSSALQSQFEEQHLNSPQVVQHCALVEPELAAALAELTASPIDHTAPVHAFSLADVAAYAGSLDRDGLGGLMRAIGRISGGAVVPADLPRGSAVTSLLSDSAVSAVRGGRRTPRAPGDVFAFRTFLGSSAAS